MERNGRRKGKGNVADPRKPLRLSEPEVRRGQASPRHDGRHRLSHGLYRLSARGGSRIHCWRCIVIMRIAQVCPFFLPVEGGVESHVLNISKELLRRGNEVHVFTCSMTRDSEKLPSTSDIDSIYVHRYPPIVVLGEFGSLWPGFMIDVISGDFDVIHAHSFRHPHTDLSAIAAKLSHSRSVLTSHSPFHPPGVRSPLARGLVPVYDHLLAPMVLKNFDRVVSLTANEAQALAALGAPRENLTVIPNGVEDVHFESIPI